MKTILVKCLCRHQYRKRCPIYVMSSCFQKCVIRLLLKLLGLLSSFTSRGSEFHASVEDLTKNEFLKAFILGIIVHFTLRVS